MKRKLAKIKNINETLLELLTGILVLGLACQAVFVWFVQDKVSYSMGLWIGVFAAAGMAVHMWRTLDISLDLGEVGATKEIRKQSLLRYGVVLILLGALMVTKAASPLAAFLGVMTLKAAAYLQPFLHKCMKKIRR